MSKYIIFYSNEPTHTVEADFYDVARGFLHFYDENNNLIGSFNEHEVDFILDEERKNKVKIIEQTDDNCNYCDELECNFCPRDENKEKDTKPTELKNDKEKFDELFLKVLGIHAEK